MKKTHIARKYWIIISVCLLAAMPIWYYGCSTHPLGPIVPTPVLTNLEIFYMQGEVIDYASQNPIEGAEIKIGRDTYTTDVNGKFIVKKAYSPGSYTFYITKDAYVACERNKAVTGDSKVTQLFKFALVKTEAPVTVEPATGGTVTATQPNYTVQVPPGAVSQSTNISITPVIGAGIPIPPDPNQLVVNSVSLQPSGTHFNMPVTISMPLSINKQLIAGKTLKVQLTEANGSTKQNVDSTWFNSDSSIVYFNVTHFSQADAFYEETINTSTVTVSKTTNFYARCNNYEVVSTTVQPPVVNNTNLPISTLESLTGVSLTAQPPVIIAIQRKQESYPQYDFPPQLQLCYDITYTRYSLASDPNKYLDLPVQIITVDKIIDTCHDQGSVN